MDGAALILLISGVGVGFGWQPMPDGSQRYEYVVQVEPEVAARLADGHSIPIVADVPEDVQPIGRIRVVVGRDTLPRQRLVTHLKPAIDAAAASADRLQLAQHNQYADPRYGAAPQAETSWNNQPDASITPTEAAPPSGQQLFGQPQPAGGDTWNNGAATATVADATAGAFDRVGQEMQRAVAPVKSGFEQVDAPVRGAVGNLGQRTRGIVEELRQPLNPQPQLPADTRPLAGAAARAEMAEAWNQDAAPAPATGNPLRTNADQAGRIWNNEPPAAGQVDQPPATPPFANNQVGGDPWAGVPDPRNQAGAPQLENPNGVPGIGTRPMPFGGVGSNSTVPGPQFPNLATPPATTPPGTAASPSPPAAVVGNMLNQPADRPLDDSLLSQIAATTGAAPPATNPILQPPATARPWSVTPPAAAATTAANPAGAASAPAVAQPAGRDNTVAVLVAWVLLTGSIAGNMYLFWSYLDVRQKYRSLVRKTARAVGSRFSAA